MCKQDRGSGLIKWILTASAFLCGLSYPFLLFALTAVLCVLTGYGAWKRKQIQLYYNRNVLAGCVFIGASFPAFLCAADRGTAFTGFFRILAMGVFVVYLMQNTKAQREEAVRMLPAAGAAMVGICMIFYPFPSLRTLVINNGRLGGAFQYANTMALYLLLGFVLLMRQIAQEREEDSVQESRSGRKRTGRCFLLFLLLTGLFWTGSRLTFVLFAGACIWLVVRSRGLGKWIAASAFASVAGALLLAGVTGNLKSFGRFLTISLHESTLLGRLLYWKDALPLLVKHPLGLGYLGYYEIQPLIRTGVYTVRYVHNDWLQIALDHGLIAFGAFLFLFVRAWIKGKEDDRLLLTLTGIHMFFDPDLAFASVVWVLMCLIDWEGKEKDTKEVTVSAKTGLCVLGMTGALMLWLGAAGFLEESGNYELSAKLYPWKASVQENLMVRQNGTSGAMQYARKAVAANPYSSAGWLAEACYYRENKEYDEMLTALQHYIALKKYDMTAYSEYIHMLDEAAFYSSMQGKRDDALKYREELLKVVDIIREVKENTDPLAWQIRDKPSFEIPAKDWELIVFYQNNPL